MEEGGGCIQTVAGRISPSSLGSTLMHEHLIADLKKPFYLPPENEEEKLLSEQPLQLSNLHWVQYHVRKSKPNLLLDSVGDAKYEVDLFVKAGGNTIVEVTPVGIGRNIRALKQLSDEMEGRVNIVCGTSYYIELTHPDEVKDLSEKQIEDWMVKEITEGIEGTNIRAGIIGEIGLSWPITEQEQKVLRAAARAASKTGACLSVHPGRNVEAPMKIVEIIKETSEVDKDIFKKTVIDHIDRTLKDVDSMLRLAATGVTLEFDLFGMECSNYPFAPMTMPNDSQRIEWIKALVDHGYVNQIVVSHDVYSKHRLTLYGGHGYQHLHKNLVPRMYTMGLTESDVKAIFVENPKRLLTFKQ